ncbi:hypothetical protein Micbo1qcDRAFT_190192 [Microdochium bolleyi]|uniref:RRM domain-containing protein n=1 Tax=Microdochium bolleyi TaxID=196109 RepID=A0A136IS23_9PEZI|nr:hypothetical protein Micbo1qcDRAFT_190192 [Microdochium bolleyi]
MSTDEVSSPVEPADVIDSKKRKAELEEIEVDLTLPEPPSKKAKRLLKKGKTLPVKKDSDDEEDEDVKQGLPPKSAGKDKHGKESKRSEHGIWVGNLPFTVTRVELFKWLVESSGGAITEESITRVNLPTSKIKAPGADKDAKPQNRGFAYVDFDKEASAIAAMALTETEIHGRKVLIKNSKSFEGRPQKEAAGQNGAGAGADGAPAAPKNTIRKIYVGNLSFQVTEDDLRHQFEKCGEIEFIKVATFEDSGKCKGFGWVRFKEPEAAESAVKGFCKIKEEIETEEDFKEAEDKSEDDNEEEEGAEKEAPKPERKYKTRKWWVNRLKGRELKIQFAEDDQVRYKKRFGKDKPQPQGGEFGDRGGSAPRARAPAKPALDLALANYRGSTNSHAPVKFTVRFAPFQLYPALPEAGQEKRAWFIDTKYAGSADKMAQFEAVMQSYGEPMGVKFSWDGSTANTLGAHRVIQWFQGAEGGNEDEDDLYDDDDDGEEGKKAARERYAAYGPATASRIVDALYRMFLEEAAHPSSAETLIKACVEAGVPEGEARRVVEDVNLGRQLATRKIRMSKSDGVDSVPTVVFEGKRRDVTLVGAKEVFEYEKALATIVKECQ